MKLNAINHIGEFFDVVERGLGEIPTAFISVAFDAMDNPIYEDNLMSVYSTIVTSHPHFMTREFDSIYSACKDYLRARSY